MLYPMTSPHENCHGQFHDKLPWHRHGFWWFFIIFFGGKIRQPRQPPPFYPFLPMRLWRTLSRAKRGAAAMQAAARMDGFLDLKWMMTGSSPIYGNLHMLIKVGFEFLTSFFFRFECDSSDFSQIQATKSWSIAFQHLLAATISCRAEQKEREREKTHPDAQS